MTRIPRMLGLTILVLFWWTSGAEAACTGSAQTWNCTAGTTSAEVNSAIGSATDGAVLTFAPGTYSWAAITFSNTKGVSLICASVGACDATVSGGAIGLTGTLSGNNTKLYRVSGFDFINAGSFTFWFYGTGTLSQVRIDHNTFLNAQPGTAIIFFGENTTVGNFYGVIDHNTFTSSGNIAAFQMIGGVNNSPPPSAFGTVNNMYFEDNTITIATMNNPGHGCMDSWGGAQIVWRYNTTVNCLVTAHGVIHAGGPANIELYGNSMSVNSGASGVGFADCYRCAHFQGSGELIAFNNLFAAYGTKSIDPLEVTHYRSHPAGGPNGMTQCNGGDSRDGNRSPSVTFYGYPCWRQPGRDFAGNLKPMYAWNNRWSDTGAQVPLSFYSIGGSPDYFAQHIVPNRDIYNAVTPFNGTVGVGVGTLANRPAACVTNPSESGGGVGYFATDQGPQGTLYRCSATNTWTIHYRPFAYPHPLQTGSASQGQGPTAPANLRISSS